MKVKLSPSHIGLLKILLASVLVPTIATEYGPSILSLLQTKRETSFLDKLLDVVEPKKPSIVELQNFPNYATVLPFADGKSWIRSEKIIDILGTDYLHSAGPFVVVPPAGHGMMVVIQELQIPAYSTFNRSVLVIDENGMIIECFSKFSFQIEGKSPVQVCGRTNDIDSFRPSLIDGVGPRSFVVPEGRSISIGFVYQDKRIEESSLISKQVPLYDFGYLFRGSIAFTAYKGCPPGPPYYDENESKIWPCDIPQSNKEPVSACVREEVFCDNVINCGMHDLFEFGIDERFCKIRKNSSSHRGTTSVLDSSLFEKAIRSRIINSDNYKDIMLEFGGHPSRPRPDLGGDYQIIADSSEDNEITHPAFVTLIILVTIVCVLITGLLFRYCCKKCVGKLDAFGHSSNPEALARFHDNLRSRDSEAMGRPGDGYSLSADTLFKPPSEDLPPSYDDLFPQEIHNNKPFDYPYPSNLNSQNSNIILVRGEVSNTATSEYPTSSAIYTIPVLQHSPSPSPLGIPENEHHFLSRLNPPALIHVGVLSSAPSNQNQREVRDAGGGNALTAINSSSSSAPLSNQTHDYPNQQHNLGDNNA